MKNVAVLLMILACIIFAAVLTIAGSYSRLSCEESGGKYVQGKWTMECSRK